MCKLHKMKDRDFIIISLNPWYTPLSSTSKHIATELAKQNRVLYVNPPLDRRTLLKRRQDPMLQRHLNVIQGKEDPLVQIAPNLWNFYSPEILESINWIPNTKIFSWFNYRNNKRIAESLRTVLEQLHFSDYILINDKDLYRGFYLKELLKPEAYVYYDRDYILSVDYWRKHGTVLEPLLAKKSDLIVTHSDYLMSLLKPYNQNIHNVGSGIDVDLFDADAAFDVPIEFRSVQTPIIGYVGALTTARLDLEALIQIAKKRPQWTLALVGPEDEDFKKSALHQMENVLFCGRKDIKEVPAYIQAMDVCINIQVINEITIGNYPLKIDEYLAMGKPVVATRTIGMRPFEGYVLMAEEGGDYVSLIEEALLDPADPAVGIELAKSHSWENILNNVYHAIEKTMRLENELSY